MSEVEALGRPSRAGFGGFLLLYAALYGGYGALSPFLPGFLSERGLSSQQIATLVAAALLVRLVAGPLASRHADRSRAALHVLVVALGLSAGFTAAMLAGQGFWPLLVIGLAQAVVTAPLAPLADSLVLSANAGGKAFEYGWVRAAGSAAFIAATVLTGYLVDRWGITSGLLVGAAGFGIAALIALGIRRAPRRANKERPVAPPPGRVHGAEFRVLAANPIFRRLVLAAALVIGAHGMHDTFAVIAWKSAGLSAGIAGLLWSESVAAEILVFLWAGPQILARIGPARAIACAALAGAVRWAVQGHTAWLPALIGVQCLHGLTFALLHLACLAIIADVIPERIRATALAVYGSVGLGIATALVTLAAGTLYAALGLRAFWMMSVLSLLAVPVALSLRAGPVDRVRLP